MKNLPPNIRAGLKMGGPLVVTILLFVVVAKFGLGKISEVRAKVAQARKNETVLSQKFEILSQVQGTVEQAPLTSSALPEKNPSLITISQLKNLAVTSGLTLTNIKAGAKAEDKSGMSRVDVTFDVDGSREAVFGFLKAVESFAPVSKVEKVKLNETGGIAHANVVVKSFFAELPKKLPALTEALKDLTADELQVLSEVSTLTQPSFVEVPPSEGGQRLDPFGI